MKHGAANPLTVAGSPPEAAWMSAKWRCTTKVSGGIASTSIASIPTLPCGRAHTGDVGRAQALCARRAMAPLPNHSHACGHPLHSLSTKEDAVIGACSAKR